MAEVHPTPNHAGKVGSFLQQSTAGLPNWAWLLVVAGGIVAAIVIPKYLNKGQSSSSATSPSGLGLAVDPTTGLPYAVEGLVPSGAGTTENPPPPAPPPPTTPPPTKHTAKVREPTSLFPGDAYEKTHPQGAQTFDSADAKTPTGYVPWSSSINIISETPVTNSTGSTFYQLEGGKYILAQDLSGIGSTGPRTNWPQNYTRSRHFRVA